MFQIFLALMWSYFTTVEVIYISNLKIDWGGVYIKLLESNDFLVCVDIWLCSTGALLKRAEN